MAKTPVVDSFWLDPETGQPLDPQPPRYITVGNRPILFDDFLNEVLQFCKYRDYAPGKTHDYILALLNKALEREEITGREWKAFFGEFKNRYHEYFEDQSQRLKRAMGESDVAKGIARKQTMYKAVRYAWDNYRGKKRKGFHRPQAMAVAKRFFPEDPDLKDIAMNIRNRIAYWTDKGLPPKRP